MDWIKFFIYPTGSLKPADLALEIRSIAASVSEKYIWENQGFEFKEASGNFVGKVDFGESPDDEWMIVCILFAITKSLDVMVSVEDSDGQFLLIEAADAIPEWLEPETSKNRVFIHKGSVHIIPIEAYPDCPSVKEALDFIQKDPFKSKASAAVQNAILGRIRPFSTKDFRRFHHRANVTVSPAIAALLQIDSSLLSASLNAFSNRSSKHMSKMFQEESNLADRVTTLVTFTKNQFARLAFDESFKAPKSYEMPLVNDLKYLACQLGLKLSAGVELLALTTNVMDKLQDFDMSKLKLINGHDDSLDWLDVDPNELDDELAQALNTFKMSENEIVDLTAEWDREYEEGKERKAGEKLKASVEKMKGFLEKMSSYEGVDQESSETDGEMTGGNNHWDSDNGSESCSDDETDGNDGDSEGEDDDEEYLEFEILETLKHDPDLLMRIVEMNAHAGVSNASLMEQLQKLTKPSDSQTLKQKGLADIDPTKLEEARRVPTRNLADHIEKEIKEKVEKDKVVEEEDENEMALSSDDEEMEERTPTLQELCKNVKKREIILSDLSDSDAEGSGSDAEANELAPRIPENMQDYFALMDAELGEKLKSSDFATTANGETDVDLNLAKSMLEGKMEGVSRGPSDTLLASTRKPKK